MDRREFLSTVGVGAAFALTASCLGGCKKSETPAKVDFTINLDDAAFAALKNNGGYVIKDSVVIARTIAGNYAAATQICSHEGNKQVVYDKTNNQWFCNSHGARFTLSGSGANSNESKGLTIYNTSLTGNSLRVFS